ncbi:spore coat protein [Halalkalibacter wakoensis JCM 9140]|uniref:Spore coat protein n=1 Tax=Halalkalibacter wakoensis JCM 9140 TaxID=1236970 RepID=W4PXH8_9BACI|nr:spore coat protein [Halalkalibacter wakoensis]GAE24390.1 spore coat protein [Halalkalibacter wakoensis JCM 9140]
MNSFIEKITGMAPLTDQVIATDILVASKAEIKNYALAITETATLDVRQTLTNQLEEVISFHEQISTYMIENGYYHPHDTKKQLQVDLDAAETAIQLSTDE